MKLVPALERKEASSRVGACDVKQSKASYSCCCCGSRGSACGSVVKSRGGACVVKAQLRLYLYGCTSKQVKQGGGAYIVEHGCRGMPLELVD